MARISRSCVALALVMLLAATASADPAAGAPEAPAAPSSEPAAAASAGPLVVAVREAPPFAMRDAAGGWRGLSVDLWQEVAGRLGWRFDWREMPLHETLQGLEAGAVDVAVAALTVTREREELLDFSHPYFVSGLAAAWSGERGGAWLHTLRSFASREFLGVVGSLVLLLLVAGSAVWLFERRANADQFGRGSTLHGLGAGFWWSAVTMTTVGYGDKAPRTLGGRLVALVWMFASLVVIASFTGAIAASVTTHRLEADLLRGRAFSELRIGAVTDSSAAEYVEAAGGRLRAFPDLEGAVAALADGAVDVVVHDAPILRHRARAADAARLEVSPKLLVRDDYGFGLPPGSPLREPINATLLEILREPVWQDIKQRYLGE